MITILRRQRMRTFRYDTSMLRRWTAPEHEHMKRAYMEGRELICPVCDSHVELKSVDSIVFLRCPGCGNSDEPRSMRPTQIKTQTLAG